MNLLSLLRRISLKHVRHQKARTIMAVSGICLGVAAVVSISIVNKSVIRSFEDSINNMTGRAALQITGAESGFPEDIIDRVRAVPGVEYAVPVVESQGIIYGAKERSLLILGIDILIDGQMRDYRLSEETADIPDPLLFLAKSDSILLTRSIAEREGIKIDQKIRIQTVEGIRTFRVRGLLNPEGPAKAMGGNVAVMDIFAAQKVFGKEGRLDRIDVSAAGGADLEALRSGILKAVPEGYSVGTSAGRSKQIEILLANFRRNINLISYLAVFVGMYLIYNAVSISVVQRKREIGILRALGATRRQIIGLFLGETLATAVIGSCLGTGLGILFARAVMGAVGQMVSEFYIATTITGISVAWFHPVLGLAAGITASLVAAAFPALASTRITPVSAIRSIPYSEDGFFSSRKIKFTSAACVLLTIAVLIIYKTAGASSAIRSATTVFIAMLFLILGISLAMPFFLRRFLVLFHKTISPYIGASGRLAGLNLQKNVMRNAVAAAAIFYGITIYVGSVDLLTSVKKSVLDFMEVSVRADILVTAGHPLATTGSQNIPMPLAMGKDIERIPGVLSVDPFRKVYINYEGKRALLITLDMVKRMQYSSFIMADGRLEELSRMLPNQDNVALNESLAAKSGLKPGDSIVLPTPIGAVRFGIAAVIVEYSSDSGTILMDVRTYQRYWGEFLADTFSVRAKSINDIKSMQKSIIEKFGDDRKLFVLSSREFKDEIRRVIDQTFIISNAIISLSLTIACFGIIITLLASVLERTREIGVLRSIGMLRRQVSRVVIFESALLGFVGGVLGAGAGVVIGWMSVEGFYRTDFGASISYHISYASLVRALLLSAALSALAGSYPAGRAAKTNITEALSYE